MVLCAAPVDQGGGAYPYRAFVDSRNLRAVRHPGWHDRALDYDAEGRLVSIELLNVSRGVTLEGLPATEVVERTLELIGVRRDAA